MHHLDDASDEDIMFGRMRGMKRRTPCIAHSLTTSIGKDLTDSHKNSDVQRLQPECNDSINDDVKTRVKETAQTDLRSTSSVQVENASSG